MGQLRVDDSAVFPVAKRAGGVCPSHVDLLVQVRLQVCILYIFKTSARVEAKGVSYVHDSPYQTSSDLLRKLVQVPCKSALCRILP